MTQQAFSANRVRRFLPRLLVSAALIAFALLMITPFLWMLSASFKMQRDVMTIPIRWIPEYFYLDNYKRVLHIGDMAGKDYHFFLAYWNSIKVAVINTAVSLLTASTAGYAFAKIKFRGANALFIVFLAQMMIPSQLTLIPRFVMFSELKLVSTHLPLILPKLISVSSTFLVRQAFLSVPDDLRESATIDGAGEYRIWAQIMLPIIMPTLGALATVQFLDSWNSYLDPLVFLSNWRLHTLPIALNQFVSEEGKQYNLVMAACCLTVIPVFIVFLCGQKFFIKGLVTGSVKG
ncbi:carbohydrate ABC transporter permease [Eubacteriales bacterium OttesenSCG-928-A19]|nr:carbohydrate ABC transporter permease [Eubacteriales bacterium OttesenSCG-928-A19]